MKPLVNLSSETVDELNTALAKLDGAKIGEDTAIKLLYPHTKFKPEICIKGNYENATFLLELSSFPIDQNKLAELTGGKPLSEIDATIANLVLQLLVEENYQLSGVTINEIVFSNEINNPTDLPISITLQITNKNWEIQLRLYASTEMDLNGLIEQLSLTSSSPNVPEISAEIDINLDSVMVDQQQLKELSVGDVIVLSHTFEEQDQTQENSNETKIES